MTTTDKRGPLQVARRTRLLEVLQRDGVLRISDLTETLGAAAVTIRRDIAQLAAAGLVRRVHGGVALPDGDDTAAVPDVAAVDDPGHGCPPSSAAAPSACSCPPWTITGHTWRRAPRRPPASSACGSCCAALPTSPRTTARSCSAWSNDSASTR